MMYADNNGMKYQSKTKAQLVVELYATSWVDPRQDSPDINDLFRYCDDCTSRIKVQKDIDLHWTTLREFIDELIKYNLILEVH